jgi:hypothetical protein
MSEGSTKPPIKRPSDILDNWDAIASQVALDGTCVSHNTDCGRLIGKSTRLLSWSVSGRLECATSQWVFPRDLEGCVAAPRQHRGPWLAFTPRMNPALDILCRLGCVRQKQRLHPKESKDGAGYYRFYARLWVRHSRWVGMWLLRHVATCYAAYSRPQEDRSQSWSWRYMAWLCPHGTEVFDNIVQVLDWYRSLANLRRRTWRLLQERFFIRPNLGMNPVFFGVST